MNFCFTCIHVILLARLGVGRYGLIRAGSSSVALSNATLAQSALTRLHFDLIHSDKDHVREGGYFELEFSSLDRDSRSYLLGSGCALPDVIRTVPLKRCWNIDIYVNPSVYEIER